MTSTCILEEKWYSFPKDVQILNIAAEFSRAKNWLAKGDQGLLNNCIERALDLIDLSISDIRWRRGLKELLRFRDLLADFYVKQNKDSQYFYKLFRILLDFNKQSAKVKI